MIHSFFILNCQSPVYFLLLQHISVQTSHISSPQQPHAASGTGRHRSSVDTMTDQWPDSLNNTSRSQKVRIWDSNSGFSDPQTPHNECFLSPGKLPPSLKIFRILLWEFSSELGDLVQNFFSTGNTSFQKQVTRNSQKYFTVKVNNPTG